MTATTKKHPTNTLALTLLTTAMAFFTLAIIPQISHAYTPKNNHLICWPIDTGFCNTPTGDCYFKHEGDACTWCNGTAPLAAACISNPQSFCIVGSNPVNCGIKFSGVCFQGACTGANPNGLCIVYPCYDGGTGT